MSPGAPVIVLFRNIIENAAMRPNVPTHRSFIVEACGWLQSSKSLKLLASANAKMEITSAACQGCERLGPRSHGGYSTFGYGGAYFETIRGGVKQSRHQTI